MLNMWALLYINSEKRGYKLESIRHLKLPGKIRTYRLKIRLNSTAVVHLAKYLIVGYLHEDTHFYLPP